MEIRPKVLLNRSFLEFTEAVELLVQLINYRVEKEEFTDLVNDNDVQFYFDACVFESYSYAGNPIPGEVLSVEVMTEDSILVRIPLDQKVKVLDTSLRYDPIVHGNNKIVYRAGLCLVTYKGRLEAVEQRGHTIRWLGDYEPEERGRFSKYPSLIPTYFKPADIQILADQINKKSSATNCEEMEALKAEIAVLKERDASLTSDAEEVAALKVEIAAFKGKVASLMLNAEEVEALKAEVAALKEENAQLREPTNATEGLVFPYSTPELKVMLDMVIQYWVNHNPETDKKPLQKTIGSDISKMLNLVSKDGTPSRQAMPLASAIRPTHLRGLK